MILLRRKIKAQREQVIYRQRRRKRILMDSVLLMIGILVAGSVILGTVSLIQGAK